MDGADVARLLISCGCTMLLGINIAFVVHAKRLFATATYNMWRWFFAGKSIMTIFVGLSIYMRVAEDKPLSWRIPLGAAGLICTNISLLRLYQLRALAFTGAHSAYDDEHEESE